MKKIIIKRIEGKKILLIPIFLNLFCFLIWLMESLGDDLVGFKIFILIVFDVIFTFIFILLFDLKFKIHKYEVDVEEQKED